MTTFKKSILCLLVGALAPLGAEGAPKSQVKILTIGNSFSNDATAYLPALAAAGGKELLLGKANIGGCSLERHVRHLKAFEANPEDPEGRPYRGAFIRSVEDTTAPAIAAGGGSEAPKDAPPPKNFSLREALEAEKWDYVTIQQLSNASYQIDTFEPYAGTLVDYIRKHAPGAEILIHQTWAYREDCPLFKNGFNQKKMFEQVVANYGKIAGKYKLRIVPVGTAIQEARKLPRWTFKYPDPQFNYKDPAPGTKPDQAGSLNVGWTVKKIVTAKPTDKTAPATPDKYVASLDFKHCNAEGRYIGGSVFYGFLFGEKVADNTFVPANVNPDDARVLRGIADDVLAKSGTAALAK